MRRIQTDLNHILIPYRCYNYRQRKVTFTAEKTYNYLNEHFSGIHTHSKILNLYVSFTSVKERSTFSFLFGFSTSHKFHRVPKMIDFGSNIDRLLFIYANCIRSNRLLIDQHIYRKTECLNNPIETAWIRKQLFGQLI